MQPQTRKKDKTQQTKYITKTWHCKNWKYFVYFAWTNDVNSSQMKRSIK